MTEKNWLKISSTFWTETPITKSWTTKRTFWRHQAFAHRCTPADGMDVLNAQVDPEIMSHLVCESLVPHLCLVAWRRQLKFSTPVKMKVKNKRKWASQLTCQPDNCSNPVNVIRKIIVCVQDFDLHANIYILPTVSHWYLFKWIETHLCMPPSLKFDADTLTRGEDTYVFEAADLGRSNGSIIKALSPIKKFSFWWKTHFRLHSRKFNTQTRNI